MLFFRPLKQPRSLLQQTLQPDVIPWLDGWYILSLFTVVTNILFLFYCLEKCKFIYWIVPDHLIIWFPLINRHLKTMSIPTHASLCQCQSMHQCWLTCEMVFTNSSIVSYLCCGISIKYFYIWVSLWTSGMLGCLTQKWSRFIPYLTNGCIET